MRPLTVAPQDVAALLEPVLARGDRIQFEARGNSMRPLIRSGDELTLEPVDGRALHVGEVALFRTETGALVAHRLVRKVGRGADTTLHFRGDGNIGELETVPWSWVLARVTALERDGRAIHLDSDWARRLASLWRVFAPMGARALYLGDELRHRAARTARKVQGTPVYRRLGRQVVAGRVRYRLGTSEDAELWNRFHRVRGVGAASQTTRDSDDPLWASEHLFTVLATAGGQLLGTTDVITYPERAELYPDWWIFGTRVGPLYRGLGIGEGILRESLRHLRLRGAQRLYLQVFSDNRPALAFYRKLGFSAASRALREAHLEAQGANPTDRNRVILTRATGA